MRISRRDRRICIVGAGAAGLAAAHALRQRGYRHLTVLEREPRVGGKCWTISYEGRSYELGAGALSRRYRNVRSLLDETGLETSAVLGCAFVDVETGRQSRLPLPRPRRWGSAAGQAARFARELWRHRALRRPGFEMVRPELCIPFEAWCSARGLEQIGEMVKPLVTGFGYGFHREVPTAYVLKYLSLFSLPLFEIRQGYGALWESVARSLLATTIRLSTKIERIARQDDHVRVHTGQGELDFDALVIACPFDAALAFLDATPLETDLFSRIRYYEYYVVAAVVDGIPRTRSLFFPEYFAPEHMGSPVFAYQRSPGQGLTCFYGFARGRPDDAAARDAVCATVERLGGGVRRTLITKCWHYFPHVASEDMAAGFYRRLEGLQGQRATYYCGELLAFSTVETTVDYARAMVAQHFPSV
jgi:glycine/D-amino acid oxidase-like deaminating enzyme